MCSLLVAIKLINLKTIKPTTLHTRALLRLLMQARPHTRIRTPHTRTHTRYISLSMHKCMIFTIYTTVHSWHYFLRCGKQLPIVLLDLFQRQAFATPVTPEARWHYGF